VACTVLIAFFLHSPLSLLSLAFLPDVLVAITNTAFDTAVVSTHVGATPATAAAAAAAAAANPLTVLPTCPPLLPLLSFFPIPLISSLLVIVNGGKARIMKVLGVEGWDGAREGGRVGGRGAHVIYHIARRRRRRRETGPVRDLSMKARGKRGV